MCFIRPVFKWVVIGECIGSSSTQIPPASHSIWEHELKLKYFFAFPRFAGLPELPACKVLPWLTSRDPLIESVCSSRRRFSVKFKKFVCYQSLICKLKKNFFFDGTNLDETAINRADKRTKDSWIKRFIWPNIIYICVCES